MYYLLKNYNIEGSSTYTSQTNVKGIFSSYTTQGDDGRSVYDGMPVFRESGGKATLTGQMNAQSKANQMYADVPGMQAIEFDLACVSDKEDVSYYEKNKETIIRGIVEGFVKTLEADGGKW